MRDILNFDRLGWNGSHSFQVSMISRGYSREVLTQCYAEIKVHMWLGWTSHPWDISPTPWKIVHEEKICGCMVPVPGCFLLSKAYNIWDEDLWCCIQGWSSYDVWIRMRMVRYFPFKRKKSLHVSVTVSVPEEFLINKGDAIQGEDDSYLVFKSEVKWDLGDSGSGWDNSSNL